MLKAGSASGRHRLVGSSAAPISVHRESLHRRLLVGSGTEPFLLGLVRENEGVAARILLDFDADSEKVRNEVIGLLNKPGERRFAPTAPRTPSSTWLEAAGLPNGLLDGAGAPLRALTAEIEDNLERRADAGDLIGLLACISEGLAARTFASLGIDADKLAHAVDSARADNARSGLLAPVELTKDIEAVRAGEEARIQAQDFNSAARLRDRELRLTDEKRELEQRRLDELLAELAGWLDSPESSHGRRGGWPGRPDRLGRRTPAVSQCPRAQAAAWSAGPWVSNGTSSSSA